MTQYLLSVWHDGEYAGPDHRGHADGVRPGRRVQRRAPGRRRVGVRRRPPPGVVATVVAVSGRRRLDDRRPVRRDQGADRRLLGHRGRRPRRRAGLGRASARSRARGPVEVRPFQGERPSSRRRDDPGVSADLPAGGRPLHRHPDPPPRRHRSRRGRGRRRRSPWPPSSGRRPGCRPTRAAGSRPPPATGPSTGCAGSRPATTATRTPQLLHDRATGPRRRPDRRARRRRRRRRRPAPPDLHCAATRRLAPDAGGAHPAAARRARDRRDRPRLPRARGDDGPAASCGPRARSATPTSPTGSRRAAELPDRLPPRAHRRST